MTQLRRAVLMSIVVLAAVEGCALPSRNNANDPNNAPDPSLRIVDATAPDGTCVPVTSSAAHAVGASTRTRCLLLDATATKVPHGTAKFRYEYATAGSSSEPAWAALADDAADTLAIGVPGMGLTTSMLPVGVPITFRVTAYTGSSPESGHRAPATASLTLLNQRPTARLDPRRTLPLGGFPWKVDGPDPFSETVRFDGGDSVDPDGDSIAEYCWSYSAINSTDLVDAGCSPSSTFDLPVSLEFPGTFRVVLRVVDGAALSLPATTTIRVGKRDSLSTGAAGDAAGMTVDLFDAGRAELPFPPTVQPVAALLHASGSERVVVAFENGTQPVLQTADWPDYANPSPLLPIASYATQIIADDAHGRVWLLTNASQLKVDCYDLSGPSPVEVQGFPVDAGPGFETEITYGSVDAAGALRVGGVPYSDVYQVAANGTVSPAEQIAGGRILGGLDARPETDETWRLEIPDWFVSSAGTPTTGSILHVESPTGPREIVTGHDYLFGLSWADSHEFWTSVSGEGVRLVDADLLDAGVSFDASTVLSAAVDVTEAFLLLADGAGGGCWTQGFQHQATDYVASDGAIRRANGDVRAQFTDPDGRLWFTDVPTASVIRGSAAGADRSLGSLVRESFAPASDDPSTGGYWVAPFIPAALERFGSDGRLAARWTRTGASSDQTLPILRGLSADPDGHGVWGLVFDAFTVQDLGIDHFEIAGSQVIRTGVVDAATLASLAIVNPPGNHFSSPPSLFAPSAPVPASTPFLWMIQTTGDVHAVPADGTAPGAATLRYAIPAAERDTGNGNALVATMADNLRTNRLCLADLLINGGPNQLFFRRVEPATASTSITPSTISMPVNGIVALSAFGDAGSDMCWLAVSDDTVGPTANGDFTVAALTEGGASARTFSETGGAAAGGRVTSIFPISQDEVWLTVDRASPTDAWTDFEHVVFSGATGSVETSVRAPHPFDTFQGPGIAPPIQY